MIILIHFTAQSIAFIQEIVNEFDSFVHKLMNKEFIIIADKSPTRKTVSNIPEPSAEPRNKIVENVIGGSVIVLSDS